MRVCLYYDPISSLPQSEDAKSCSTSRQRPEFSTAHLGRAQGQLSSILGVWLAKCIGLSACEVQYPALKNGQSGGVCLCVCLTEVAHLAGHLCNLIPQGGNFFLISAYDQILPCGTRLKCPYNFSPEETNTNSSFSRPVRDGKNEGSSGKTLGVGAPSYWVSPWPGWKMGCSKAQQHGPHVILFSIVTVMDQI